MLRTNYLKSKFNETRKLYSEIFNFFTENPLWFLFFLLMAFNHIVLLNLPITWLLLHGPRDFAVDQILTLDRMIEFNQSVN